MEVGLPSLSCRARPPFPSPSLSFISNPQKSSQAEANSSSSPLSPSWLLCILRIVLSPLYSLVFLVRLTSFSSSILLPSFDSLLPSSPILQSHDSSTVLHLLLLLCHLPQSVDGRVQSKSSHHRRRSSPTSRRRPLSSLGSGRRSEEQTARGER